MSETRQKYSQQSYRLLVHCNWLQHNDNLTQSHRHLGPEILPHFEERTTTCDNTQECTARQPKNQAIHSYLQPHAISPTQLLISKPVLVSTTNETAPFRHEGKQLYSKWDEKQDVLTAIQLLPGELPHDEKRPAAKHNIFYRSTIEEQAKPQKA